MPQYPLANLPQRTRWFQALLVVNLVILGLMSLIGLPLNTPAAPQGIVSFEVAGTPEQTQVILDSWDTPAQVRAAFIQGLDSLFLLVYSTCFGLGCLLSGEVLRRAGWPLAGAANGMAWGLWLAAGFDFIENLGLALALFNIVAAPWPQIAAICAYLKFGLLFLGLAYLFYGLAARLTVQPTRG